MRGLTASDLAQASTQTDEPWICAKSCLYHKAVTYSQYTYGSRIKCRQFLKHQLRIVSGLIIFVGSGLGISAFYHDSAAALVRDGEIIAATQEERFTRRKGDASFPTNAVACCLAEGLPFLSF